MEQNNTSSLAAGQKDSSSLKIDSRIQSALDYCSNLGISSFVLALPFEVPLEQILWLRTEPRIRGVVICSQDESLRQQFGDWLGTFIPSEYTWKLPLKSAKTVVYIGRRSNISFRMLKAAIPRGVRSIVCLTAISWIKVSVLELLIGRLSLYIAAKFEPIISPDSRPLNWILGKRINRYKRVLATKGQKPRMNGNAIRRRVLLVNASLAPGGAERQVVNTITGLREHDLRPFLLCEHLFDRPDHDFYLSKLQKLDVRVWQIENRLIPSHHLIKLLDDASLVKALNKLPLSLVDDILAFYDEFRTLQPEVVHAWQDSCSIRAGIAGILAGVPRIVLSFRNVSPRHFHYHQPYLKPSYQALADHHNVIFTNNSLAGARDYAHWLGLPLPRFRIIRNGVDFSNLKIPDDIEKTHFRNKIGIPHSAPIIGSVFRFYPEKRPLLWIQMAAEVATQIPEAHFVLVGWGPLQKPMEDLATQLNLQHRLHILPPYSNVAVPLSTMDLFVLTSQFEGTPNVVLESQWLGVPIVTTNAGGTPEAIDPNITGWVAEPPRAEELAKQVVSILCDSERLKKAKASGPAFILREFSMNRMVEETMTAYGI